MSNGCSVRPLSCTIIPRGVKYSLENSRLNRASTREGGGASSAWELAGTRVRVVAAATAPSTQLEAALFDAFLVLVPGLYCRFSISDSFLFKLGSGLSEL